MTNHAASFVGSIPENYDKGLGPQLFEDYGAELARRVAAHGPATTLELAAGTGILSRRLRDGLPAGAALTVTDLNPPMLEVAKSKFRAGEDVDFQSADATDLPFADKSFDAVVCQFGVMFFPDKACGFAEAHRVLRTGGRYFFNTWKGWAANPFAEIAHAITAEVFPDDPPGFYKVPFSYADQGEIERALGAAGFLDIAIESIERTQPIPSAELFATGIVYGNPLYDEIVKRGGDAADIHARMVAAIADRLGDRMPLCAIFVEARRP